MRRRALLSRNEEGVVLVLCLITLVVLTLIGIGVTTTTRLEAEISGNDKTSKESFYAAELALGSGETVIESLLSREDLNEGTTPGRYPKVAQPPQPAWNAIDAWDDVHSAVAYSVTAVPSVIPSGFSKLSAAPRYTITVEDAQLDSLRVGIGVPKGIYKFDIAARGTGSNATSETVLQSLYAKRYN